MHLEKEITILNINKAEFIKLLESKGAVRIGDEVTQIRYTYDVKPKNPNKWIRLRTNGEKSTLTVKEITQNSKMNTKEWEVEVSNFEETNKILNELGFEYRNKQENKRQIYKLNNIEISIDTWPLIPPYAELEADNENDILNLVKELDINEKDITYLDVTSIYMQIYGINILQIKELEFSNENMLEFNK